MRSDLIQELREEALALERQAWSRPDGGQECSLSASLANRAADALEEALKVIADLIEVVSSLKSSGKCMSHIYPPLGDTIRAARDFVGKWK